MWLTRKICLIWLEFFSWKSHNPLRIKLMLLARPQSVRVKVNEQVWPWTYTLYTHRRALLVHILVVKTRTICCVERRAIEVDIMTMILVSTAGEFKKVPSMTWNGLNLSSWRLVSCDKRTHSECLTHPG